MVNVSVARRYARALIGLANEGAGLETTQAQLEAIAQIVVASTELRDLMVNPAYTRGERWAVLQSILQMQGVSDPTLVNFLHLLVDRDRIAQINEIALLFRDMADALAGRLRGRVTSAAPLPEELLRTIKKGLERLTDRQVMLEASVEPSLLGGVMAQVGSTVYDGSLKSHLEELRKELKQD
jgi:F-type H+-transporting ATPase subunit delta